MPFLQAYTATILFKLPLVRIRIWRYVHFTLFGSSTLNTLQSVPSSQTRRSSISWRALLASTASSSGDLDLVSFIRLCSKTMLLQACSCETLAASLQFAFLTINFAGWEQVSTSAGMILSSWLNAAFQTHIHQMLVDWVCLRSELVVRTRWMLLREHHGN